MLALNGIFELVRSLFVCCRQARLCPWLFESSFAGCSGLQAGRRLPMVV